MARKPNKSRVAAPAEEPVGSIFDHFAAQGREWDTGAPRAAGKPAEPSISDLMSRIDGLTQQNDTMQRQLELSALRAPAPAPVQTQRVDPRGVKFDPTGLPDPIEDRKGYDTELATRINAMMDAREHGVRQDVANQSEQVASAQRLWDGFKDAHPEWAPYEKLVGVVAQQVAQGAEARGTDVHKYMFSTPELFYRDVASQLKTGYGKLLEGEDEGDDEQQQVEAAVQRRGKPKEDDLEDGRTSGIHGGLETGGRPARQSPAAGDMIEDLRQIQRRSGFF